MYNHMEFLVRQFGSFSPVWEGFGYGVDGVQRLVQGLHGHLAVSCCTQIFYTYIGSIRRILSSNQCNMQMTSIHLSLDRVRRLGCGVHPRPHRNPVSASLLYARQCYEYSAGDEKYNAWHQSP